VLWEPERPPADNPAQAVAVGIDESAREGHQALDISTPVNRNAGSWAILPALIRIMTTPMLADKRIITGELWPYLR
jgi:hypothetical protein